jgi:hypothetical protein
MIMQIKHAEKLRKTTLRERIHEKVVHLILSGVAEWRMGEREAGDRKTAGESNPVPRGDRDACKRVGWSRLIPITALMCAAFLAARPQTSTNYTTGLNSFAVELAIQQMSDRDIRRYENILNANAARDERRAILTPARIRQNDLAPLDRMGV